MRTDARIRYTKMIIKDSFIKLLKKHPINKITVKDVCDLAEMNRATFYKHYTDCFDLIKQIEDELIDELIKLVKETRHKNITDIFGEILSTMKENGELYMTLFSENGDTTFPARIFNLCYEQIDLPIEVPSISKPQQEWLYYFMAYGCSGILNHWAANEMREDISEISKYVGKLSEKMLR